MTKNDDSGEIDENLVEKHLKLTSLNLNSCEKDLNVTSVRTEGGTKQDTTPKFSSTAE